MIGKGWGMSLTSAVRLLQVTRMIAPYHVTVPVYAEEL
jgi:hypothetical protein